MQPTPGDVHVNTPLSNISVAYIQDSSAFIADKVFPNIPVSKQSDLYFSYDRGAFNRDEMTLRAPGTESQGSGYTVAADQTYFCARYSFHHDVPDEVRANADAALNPDREATVFVTQKALIKREKLFVSKYFKTGVWATDYTGVASAPSGNQRIYWTDAASDPIAEIKAAKRLQLEQTGFEPNTLILGRAVIDGLLENPDIIDRIKYGQTPGAPAMANRETLAKLFEVDRIFVMNAIENTGKEGAANSSSFIGGKHALLAHVTPMPGLMTPTAGYTFSWTGMYGNSGLGTRIRSFRLEQLGVDRVEIDMCFDMKVVGSDLGTFWSGIVQ